MKIQCPCGELVHDAGDGLPNKAHFIADGDWDAFWEAVDAAGERSGPSPRATAAAPLPARAAGAGPRGRARFMAGGGGDACWGGVDAAVERSGPSPRDKEAAVMRLR